MTGWLVDTLVWTGVLIALVLALRGVVARYFGPQTAYALWLLPFARLFLPPLVLPAWLAPVSEATVPDTSTTEALVRSTPPSDFGQVADAAPPFDWVPLLLAIWLGGAALLIAWRVHRYAAARTDILAASHPVGDVDGIPLVESPLVAAPLAFGIRAPVIALPVGYINAPQRAARDLAIAHELAHHRARDILVNFAAQPLFALHWFNPLGWLGWRALRRDQEAACDMRVVKGAAPQVRALYAETIASFAGTQGMANYGFTLAAPMASPVLGEKSVILRLRNLAMKDVTPARQRTGRWLLASAALALPLTASISYAAADRVPPAPANAPLPPKPPVAAAVADAPSVRAAPAAPLAPLAPPAPRPVQAAGGSGEPPAPPPPPILHVRDAQVYVARAEDGLTVIRNGRTYTGEEAERLLETMEIEIERDMERIERDIERTVERALETAANAEELQRYALVRAREGLIVARAQIAAQTDLSAKERAEALRGIDEAIAELRNSRI